MKYVFIDTNVLIHFHDFEQINWNEVTNSSDEITIVIASTIVDELDKHKYNSNKKVSRKVKKLLPRLESFIERTGRCKYKLIYIEKKPSDEIFRDNSLDKNEQDDCILAAILEFTSNHLGESIAYVTNDVGPRLKAKRLGITAVRPPDRYLVSEELDASEKELITLQKELQSLKNRIPVLIVLFENETDLLSFDPGTRRKISREEFVQKQMDEVKSKHSRMYYYPPEIKSTHPLAQFASNPLFSPSEEQTNQYNEELEKFYNSYEEYANSLYMLYLLKYNSIEIKFILRNTGTTPAQDIDLSFHFPDGFDMFSKQDIPTKPSKKPGPPLKPKSRLDVITNLNLPNAVLDRLSPMPTTFPQPNIDLNVGKPDIRKTNSYDVNFHVRTLKHHQSETLETLYINFDDIHSAKGFTIDYKIIAANIPNPVTGRLHVRM